MTPKEDADRGDSDRGDRDQAGSGGDGPRSDGIVEKEFAVAESFCAGLCDGQTGGVTSS